MVSAVIAIVFGVLITDLRNDLNSANARSTSSTGALQELVMELAEMGGLNTTYEEIVSGHCQTNNGCFDDVYIGSYRLLLARVGPLTALVAEVGPLATLDVKKKKLDPHTRTAKRRGTARAPGDGRTVECYNDGDPFLLGELFNGQLPVLQVGFLTSGQIANFNLTGPNVGNGAGQSFWLTWTMSQNYAFSFLSAHGDVALHFVWYPDLISAQEIGLISLPPTKFTLGVVSSLGSTTKRKRDVVRGSAQQKVRAGPNTPKKIGH